MTEKILVPAAEAAAMLSMGKSTFWREVAKGTLPAPVKIGGLIVRCLRGDQHANLLSGLVHQ